MSTKTNSVNESLFGPFRKMAFLFLLVFLIPLMMFATHFRYGNISWTNPSANTVTFKIQQSWRLSYPWGQPIAVGGTINIGGSAIFQFGDGTTANIILTITSINVAEDWFYGEATIVKTYASPGLRTAFWQSGDRIHDLQNNPDGLYRVETNVNVGAGNSSPLANINPIVNLAVGNPTASFLIPAIDPNGNPLSFALATAAQAAGGGAYVHPPALSVNGATGVVSFPTTGKTVGHLYTTQIIISDGASHIAIDFIIKIVAAGNPPVFIYPPTPPNNSTLSVVVGNTLIFNVQASDPDVQNVSLSAAGVPIGATFVPPLGTSGNPIGTQFSWTPTLAQVGNYIVAFQAQDAVGLSALTNVNIQVILCNMSLGVGGTTNVACHGGNTGAINLTITNGKAPLSIVWSNGATTEDVSGLAAGTYSVTVTDANNCQETLSGIQITQPTAPLSLSATTVNVACYGASTGSIDLTASGGTGTPTYSWSNGATTEDISGLAAGSYTVTATDANGCNASETFTIGEPAAPLSLAATTVNVACYGASTGSIDLTSSGGTGTPTYSWSNGATTEDISGLAAGSYTVTATDANGCTASETFTIGEPATAVSCNSITVSPNPTVAGQALNTIFVGYGPQTVTLTGSGSGGTGSLSYGWSNGGTGSVISVSPTATTTYTLTITDGNGCTATCSVTINVVDARCGSKLEKVLVCHLEGNGIWNNVCVSSNAVATHLTHGDYVGPCPAARPITNPVVTTTSQFQLLATPNPSQGNFTLRLNTTGNEKISIRVMDLLGRQVEQKINVNTNAITIGGNYKPGVYYVEVMQGGNRSVIKLIKTNPE